MVAAAVAVVAVGCTVPSDRDVPVAAGEQVFANNCAQCHGPDLQGTKTGPPLLHEVYEPSHHPDDAIRSAVANGVLPHHWEFGPMPAQPQLSDDDTEAVITYIRTQQQAAGIE